MRYIVIEPTGDFRAVTTPELMTLKEMQTIVGGYIEAWHCSINGVKYDAMVNEEGWILEPRLPINVVFPEIAGAILLGHIDHNVGDFYGVRGDELTDVPFTATKIKKETP